MCISERYRGARLMGVHGIRGRYRRGILRPILPGTVSLGITVRISERYRVFLFGRFLAGAPALVFAGSRLQLAALKMGQEGDAPGRGEPALDAKCPLLCFD